MEVLRVTDDLLVDLRLHGIKQSLSSRLHQAQTEQASIEDFLNLILHDEKEFRHNAKIKRLLISAKRLVRFAPKSWCVSERSDGCATQLKHSSPSVNPEFVFLNDPPFNFILWERWIILSSNASAIVGSGMRSYHFSLSS